MEPETKSETGQTAGGASTAAAPVLVFKTERWLAGYYRVSAPGCRAYGSVRRSRTNRRMWLADLHDSKTGDHKCPAGLWRNKQDAIEECEFQMRQAGFTDEYLESLEGLTP